MRVGLSKEEVQLAVAQFLTAKQVVTVTPDRVVFDPVEAAPVFAHVDFTIDELIIVPESPVVAQG